MSHIVSEIIVVALDRMKKAQAALEIEESGRTVASLQGQVAGYKEFLDNLDDSYSLPPGATEYTGDVPMDFEHIDDELLETMSREVQNLPDSPAWEAVIDRIDANIANYKKILLFEAEKSRDLDLYQGRYKAQVVYREIFSAIEEEMAKREAQRKESKRNPELQFDRAMA
jgi:hypothetical protein